MTRRYTAAVFEPVPGQVAMSASAVMTSDAGAVQITRAPGWPPDSPAPTIVSFTRDMFASLEELARLAPAALNPGAEAIIASDDVATAMRSDGAVWQPMPAATHRMVLTEDGWRLCRDRSTPDVTPDGPESPIYGPRLGAWDVPDGPPLREFEVRERDAARTAQLQALMPAVISFPVKLEGGTS